jgi:hypothetical protein
MCWIVKVAKNANVLLQNSKYGFAAKREGKN